MPHCDKKAKENPKAAAFLKREKERRKRESEEGDKRDKMTDEEYYEKYERIMIGNQKKLLL